MAYIVLIMIRRLFNKRIVLVAFIVYITNKNQQILSIKIIEFDQ